MPINERSIGPAMIEAGDRSHVSVVDGQLLYRIIEGTAFLNAGRATLPHRQCTAVRLDLGGHAARVLDEPQHAVAHFLVLQAIELFYKVLLRATVGGDKTRHSLGLAHKSLPCPVRRDLERRFQEIAARISFDIHAVATWVGEEPERREVPDACAELGQHLEFLDGMRWHLYRYSDERLTEDSGRGWGYFYANLDGWIEFSHFIRGRALEEAIREGAFSVPHAAMSSGFVLPAEFLEALDDV